MARFKKSVASSLRISGLSMLIFIVAMIAGISMLSGCDDRSEMDDVSSSDPVVESSDVPESEEPTPEEESIPDEESTPAEGVETSSTESKPLATVPGTTSSTATATTSSVAPVAKPSGFDVSIMGNSGVANIEAHKKINSDVMGWIKVPGTNIDSPILFDDRILSVEEGFHYYLEKNLYKQYSGYFSTDGVIYADPHTKFGDSSEISSNTVIYGHNWRNCSAYPAIGNPSHVMFEQLAAYHHLSFAQAHPYIYYSTEDEEMVWQVFATFYTDLDFYYNNANAKGETLDAIINGAKARSSHIFDVPVTSEDKIITLSTCTRAFGKSDQQRFVVMAKQIPIPADNGYKSVKVTTNPDPIRPILPVA